MPVLAYYYIWFNASSWSRAKRDTPLLGRYSSDERSVMERQVAWAQQSGIDGFVVSWKDTPVLDRRLETLIEVATRAHFRLGMIYEGLDFHRNPLPVARVRADLETFARRYAGAAPFALLRRPLVCWSGTWRYTPAQIASVTAGLRGRLTILATERSLAGYAHRAGAVDGNAYYWSSPDPLRTPGYARKLRTMGAAVHRRHGMWIAPAAPGFDARLIGGVKVVPRRDGKTLRRALAAAAASSPDALGVISWNEFTENSHVEPSRRYGFRALRVLAAVLGAPGPRAGALAAAHATATGPRYGAPVLVAFVVVLLGGGIAGRRRRNAARRVRPDEGHRRTPPRDSRIPPGVP